jgi:hypothetical protein
VRHTSPQLCPPPTLFLHARVATLMSSKHRNPYSLSPGHHSRPAADCFYQWEPPRPPLHFKRVAVSSHPRQSSLELELRRAQGRPGSLDHGGPACPLVHGPGTQFTHFQYKKNSKSSKSCEVCTEAPVLFANSNLAPGISNPYILWTIAPILVILALKCS